MSANQLKQRSDGLRQNDQKGQQAKLLTFRALNNLAPPYVTYSPLKPYKKS